MNPEKPTVLSALRYRMHNTLTKKASVKSGVIAFVITVLSLWIFAEQVHFIKSPTDSMPEHYFVHFLHITPKKGQITLVYNDWYKGSLIKRIIGVEGDLLTYDHFGNLSVEGKFVGKTQLKASDGRALTPIKPLIIPKDYVFLYAPHPKSLDSRYAEIGLVHVDDLKGLLFAVG